MTGPPDQFISFCSSANSGILPSRSSGEPPPADAAEQRAEAERVARPGRRPALVAALGIAVGEAEAERARHSCVHGRRVIFAPWRVAGARSFRPGRTPPCTAVADIGSPVVTRRIAVLTAGVVLLVLFGVLGTTLPVPYVAQVPGPTFNTLGDIDGEPIISVEGREPNDVERQPQPDHRGRQPRRAQPGPGGARLVRRRGRRRPRGVGVPAGPSEEETRQANRRGVPDLGAGGRDASRWATSATR